MIAKNSIENLKTTLDVVDVISQFLQLKKSGANFKACCPFHGEDTPSFVVSPQKQIYHCFGCGVGGDSIKFLMEYEKLTYPEAIEKLASMYNFNLEYENSNYKKQDISVVEKLNSYYIKLLSSNQIAMQYLQERGVWESSIEKFEIGFAPNSSQTIGFLKQNMLNLSDAKEFGLIDHADNGLYARFIDRITFPIYTINGNICGFGGRTISGHNAKYINSPQTKIFNKSRLLYGYNLANKQIYKKNQIIVTEGYLDVVMLHQAGFDNAVATLGTALTNDHLPLLKRGEPKVIVAYDGDKAGLNAAFKASVLLSQNNFEGGVVIFEEGKDPADMVKDGAIEELNNIFDNAQAFIPFTIDMIALKYNLSNPLEKQKALNEINQFLGSLNQLIQDEYQKYVSIKLDINAKHVNSTKNSSSRPQNVELSSVDIAELNMIKTALESDRLCDLILNVVDIAMFERHSNEFNMLLNDRSNPILIGISLKDEFKIYSEDELQSQLNIFLVRFYTRQIQYIKLDASMEFKKKANILRKIQENIQKLKKGELIPYNI
ncbi:MAG: DNA primase [Campylobacterales bacterium]|nr:DNA primase [Campylobacterales bacterium]